MTRRLAHEPFGHRPTTLLLTFTRFRCADCRHVWRQDTSCGPVCRDALRRALEAMSRQHLSVARVAEALAVSWEDRVAVIGVDELAWRHTRRGNKCTSP